MNLNLQPFTMIRSGQKTIELRLNDEKRQQIKANDEMEFSCTDSKQAPFTVRVIKLHFFKTFAELYASLPLLKCGYTSENISDANPDDMNKYYSAEEQSKYGVVGIEFELIQE